MQEGGLARGSGKMAKQAKKESYVAADIRIRKGQPEEDRKRRKTGSVKKYHSFIHKGQGKYSNKNEKMMVK